MTICSKNRLNIFSKIHIDNVGTALAAVRLQLTELGNIIDKQWQNMSSENDHVGLDEYIIMPNHLHGIINIDHRTGASPVPTLLILIIIEFSQFLYYHIHVLNLILKSIRWVFRHPRLVLALTGVVLLLSLIILPKLQIDNSVDVFFNKKGANYINFEQWKQQFGSDQVVMIALQADDIFTTDHLSLISDLTEDCEMLPGVETVTSLATVNDITGQGQDFIVERFLDQIPDQDLELARLKNQALSNPLYVKNVISPDGTVAAVLVELETDAAMVEDGSSRKETIDAIQKILSSRVSPDVYVYLSGLTAIEYFYALYMQDDFKAFMPFLLMMIIAVMYLSFRSVKLVVLPLVSILISTACAMALLHLMGFSVNNVTTVIPPILMAIMIADSVHVIGDVLKRRASEAMNTDDRESLLVTMRHLAFPCFLTSATTAAGFWSLSLSSIAPVRQLGIIVGFGVVLALILSFTFLPSAARIWGAFAVRPSATVRMQNRLEAFLGVISRINQSYYKTIVILSVVLVGVSAIGLMRIKAETSVIEYFRKSTPIYRATQFVENHLSGVHTVNISLKTGQRDFFKDPKALMILQEITGFLETIPEVDKVSSVNDYIKEIHRSFHDEDPVFYRIPESRRMVSQYVLLYGRQDLEDFVDDDWQWATIRVRLKEHSTVRLSAVLDQMRHYLERYRNIGGEVRVIGQTVLEAETNNAVAQGQLKSLLLAMLVIFGMMFMVFRSFIIGLISVVPNILPILMNFGLMGFCGIHLDSATSMIAAVGIGIVVDDTIHFLYGFGEAFRENADHARAVDRALREKGRPIIFTSLILFFGFGVLSVSKFLPTAYFGMLSALLMFNALISDLFVLPSLLIWLRPSMPGAAQESAWR